MDGTKKYYCSVIIKEALHHLHTSYITFIITTTTNQHNISITNYKISYYLIV